MYTSWEDVKRAKARKAAVEKLVKKSSVQFWDFLMLLWAEEVYHLCIFKESMSGIVR